MRLILIVFVVFSLANLPAWSQKILKVYHGTNSESQVYNRANQVLENSLLQLKQGETLTIEVVNANPVLYNYSIKYDDITVESEDKAITDLLTKFNTILAVRSGAALTVITTPTEEYKKAVNLLIQDINEAKQAILASDVPETPLEALSLARTGGLRKALYQLSLFPNAQFRFNSSTLLTDLNNLSQKAAADAIETQAFGVLNSSLVEKVNDLKKQANLQSTQTIWRSSFKVTDAPKKLTLVITKIDKNANLIRDGSGEKEFQLELATVIPYYKRAVLEIVPVANFIFSNDVREFYLDNSLVQSRLTQKTTTRAGLILNANVANFGTYKEMSAGVGLGYQFSLDNNAFTNLYFSTLFSYKNFLRIGLGLGWAQFPKEELKGGGKIGQPLPPNVANLDDLLNYEEKPSAFLTLSFVGLNLTKKK